MRTREKQTANLGTTTISLFPSAKGKTPKNYTLENVIEWIRAGSGNFANDIKRLREAVAKGDQHEASLIKTRLPAATFSGTFTQRESKGLEQHSGIICMDIDKIANPEDRIEELREDPFVVAAFVSPSGNGIKILIRIPDDPSTHRDSFDSAKQYLETYNLECDESGKDVSRLCFLSHDPEVHYSPLADELPIVPLEPTIASVPKEKGSDRVGDKYEGSPDIRDRSLRMLTKLGWKVGRSSSSRVYCTRPNKESGVSGELREDGSFYCYTSNAHPLAGETNYSPFALYTCIEHSGDFKSAAKSLAEEFGEPNQGIGGREYYAKDIERHEKEQQEKQEQQRAELVGNLPQIHYSHEIPEDLSKIIIQKYPVLVDGLIHRGTKTVLGGGSKSYKTWTLLNLAISVATGTPWMGRQVSHTGLDVIFVNFEVAHEFFLARVNAVYKALGVAHSDKLGIWSLRGICNDLSVVLDGIRAQVKNGISLIVIDPIYKGLAGRDENSAGDIGQLMNEVERIVEETGAAVAFGAHYSKGNQADKDPLDRISGSGVFARDPDTILGLTQHESEGCFTVNSALRNFPAIDPFVVEWDFPIFNERRDLDPNKLKKRNQKVSDDKVLACAQDFLHGITGHSKTQLSELIAQSLGVGKSTIDRRIKNYIDAGDLSYDARNKLVKMP